MVTVPLRAAPVFADAESTTVPSPVPPAPDLIVMNDAVVDAVQLQVCADAFTCTVTSPPAAGIAGSLVLASIVVPSTDNVNVHVPPPPEPASCETVNVCPAMVI